MGRRFECLEESSSKFWEISQSGAQVTVAFGRVGSKGQERSKAFATEAEAARHAEKLMAEKTKKGYSEVGPSRTAIDIAEACRKIEATVRELSPEDDTPLPPGATLEELAELEKEMKVRFSEAFKQAWLLHNGSNGLLVCPNACFLPLSLPADDPGQSVLRAWRDHCSYIKEWYRGEYSYPEGPIRCDRFHRKWIPISYNGGGDYDCLDFAPLEGGTIGQVIHWNHEVGAVRVVAPSFAEWLLGLPHDLQTFHQREHGREEKIAREARDQFAAEGCWGPPKLAGKTILFEGQQTYWPVEMAAERVTAEGGRLVEEVDATLNYIVVGSGVRSLPPSLPKAKDLNDQGLAEITILMDIDFFALLSPTREELLRVLLGRPDKERWYWLTTMGTCWSFPLPDLNGIDLRGADLRGLDLWGLPLTGANLSDANLTGCGLSVEAGRFDRASLVNARPRRMTGSSFRQADLSGADLDGADLDGCDLTEAKLKQVGYHGGTARGACFRGADLSGSRIDQVNLAGSDFSQANLSQTSLLQVDLSGSNLAGANLESADLSRAKLTDVNFSRANLRRANLAGATLTGAIFRDADLSEAILDQETT